MEQARSQAPSRRSGQFASVGDISSAMTHIAWAQASLSIDAGVSRHAGHFRNAASGRAAFSLRADSRGASPSEKYVRSQC